MRKKTNNNNKLKNTYGTHNATTANYKAPWQWILCQVWWYMPTPVVIKHWDFTQWLSPLKSAPLSKTRFPTTANSIAYAGHLWNIKEQILHLDSDYFVILTRTKSNQILPIPKTSPKFFHNFSLHVILLWKPIKAKTKEMRDKKTSVGGHGTLSSSFCLSCICRCKAITFSDVNDSYASWVRSSSSNAAP